MWRLQKALHDMMGTTQRKNRDWSAYSIGDLEKTLNIEHNVVLDMNTIPWRQHTAVQPWNHKHCLSTRRTLVVNNLLHITFGFIEYSTLFRIDGKVKELSILFHLHFHDEVQRGESHLCLPTTSETSGWVPTTRYKLEVRKHVLLGENQWFNRKKLFNDSLK